jgi:hypothetical protein
MQMMLTGETEYDKGGEELDDDYRRMDSMNTRSEKLHASLDSQRIERGELQKIPDAKV